jgi:hypothetical protein
VKENLQKKAGVCLREKYAAALKLQERCAIGEWEQGHRLGSSHPAK